MSDIRKLVIRGYPTADNITRDTINVHHFIKGLLDQQAALHIGMRTSQTIEEASTILETYNSLKDEMKGGARIREVQTVKKSSSSAYMLQKKDFKFLAGISNLQLGKKIDILAKQIKESQDKQPKRQQIQKSFDKIVVKDIVCYNCWKAGHILRYCTPKDNGESAEKKLN